MPHQLRKPAAPCAALPGLSRAAVARNLGISETQVARIEARALLKARAEFERRGMNFRAILAILSQPVNQ